MVRALTLMREAWHSYSQTQAPFTHGSNVRGVIGWRHRYVADYINTLLRMRPTASPSMAKGSPGRTTMVG